jgi:hypothetical protein
VIERVRSESERRDEIPYGDLVEEALREKFQRIDTGRDEGWGPLAGLDEKDRGRMLRFRDCLLSASRLPPAKARKFRKAIDANYDWLADSVE